jgi:methionine synthase I (cobalamin-dependent)
VRITRSVVLTCEVCLQSILDILKEHVLIYDGATGTNLQTRNLTADDYWGKEGCNELLVLSRPDVIRDLHASFFEVGSDIGVRLTEGFHLKPEQSTNALIVHHPQAKYCVV